MVLHIIYIISQAGWGWKGPLQVIWSNSSAQARPPTADCSGPCPDSFWISPSVEIPQLRRAAYLPVLGHPHNEKCFLMLRGNLLCFSLCPLPLVLLPGSTEKSLALSPLHPPQRYLYMLISYPIVLVSWTIASPDWAVPAFSASPHRRGAPVSSSSWPLWDSLCTISMSLLYWAAQKWTQDSRCGLTGAEERERITSLHFCLMQWRIPFAFSAARADCWLMGNWVSTRTPRSFFAKVLSSQGAPNT